MRLLPLIFSLLLALTGSAPAFLHEVDGTVLPILKKPLSARAQGLGGAGSAIVDDGAYATLNPACILNSEEDRLYFEHINFYQGQNFEFLNATLRYSAFPVGVSLAYYNLGSGIVTTNGEDADTNNTFHMYDAVLQVTTGFVYKNVKIGMTAKYLRESIWNESSNGAALDLGAIVKTPVKNLSAAVSLLNLGAMSSFVQDNYPLSSTLRLGTAYTRSLTEGVNLHAALDLNASNDGTLTLPLGAEVAWDYFALRAGYALLHDTQSFSAGLSLTYGNFELDYCYVHYTDELNSNGRPHFFALSLLL